MSNLKEESKEDIVNDLMPEGSVNNIDKMQDNNIESLLTEVYVDQPMKVMPTLPQSFKSLVNISVDITNENRNASDIIELLGSALGIDDYKTNVASFWFLDFITLQVLKYESVLDSRGLSVMISWLAGEMKLIQEKKFTRKAFFHAMEEIFINCSDKLSRGISLVHWDIMMANNNYSYDDINAKEEIAQEPKEKKSSKLKISKRRLSTQSSLSEDRTEFSERSSSKLKSDAVENTMANHKDPTIPEIDVNNILDIIIEATYNMYGNRFHYALIVAAFVKPVELHEYILPLTFRKPRPIKMYEVQKVESKKIGKAKDSAAARNSKETKKSKDNKKSKRKSKDTEMSESTLQLQPSIVLTDEEILMKKREYILPLMEANEASTIIASYKEANLQKKNIVG